MLLYWPVWLLFRRAFVQFHDSCSGSIAWKRTHIRFYRRTRRVRQPSLVNGFVGNTVGTIVTRAELLFQVVTGANGHLVVHALDRTERPQLRSDSERVRDTTGSCRRRLATWAENVRPP